jgi:hypothetical protein
MSVFSALVRRVKLYCPLQAPAGGKVASAGGKYFTARWSNFQSKSQAAKLGKMSKRTKLHIFRVKKSSTNSNFYLESVFDVNYYILVSQKVRKSSACPHLENGD